MSRTGGAGTRVLYVDDDAALARLVSRRLVRQGYQVVLARDAAEGLARLSEGGIDAVALDNDLPGRTGLEALPDFLAVERAPPVVFVTGADDVRVAVAALKAGADDYVVKDVAGEFMPLLRVAFAQSIERASLRRAREATAEELRTDRDRAAAMLREVNHRLANSLQLVSAFIHMQAASLRDPTAKAVLQEAQGRILAVAQIHRRLYTSEDVRSVELKAYLEGLVEELASSVGDGATPGIQIEAETARVPTDKAVSVGVIVAELVSNAVKYAYPGRDLGPIRVRFTARDGRLELIVEDDGVGWSGEGTASGTGLGQKIVRVMVASLKGTLEFGPAGQGTRVRIAFPG